MQNFCHIWPHGNETQSCTNPKHQYLTTCEWHNYQLLTPVNTHLLHLGVKILIHATFYFCFTTFRLKFINFYFITLTALVTSYFSKLLFWHIKHSMCFYNSHCLTVYTIQLKSFVNKSICRLTRIDNENLSWFQFNKYGPLLIWIVKGMWRYYFGFWVIVPKWNNH